MVTMWCTTRRPASSLIWIKAGGQQQRHHETSVRSMASVTKRKYNGPIADVVKLVDTLS